MAVPAVLLDERDSLVRAVLVDVDDHHRGAVLREQLCRGAALSRRRIR